MATIQDIPSTEAPAVSRGKIVANFEALNAELIAATAAVAGKEDAGTAAAAVAAHVAAADPHPNYALEADVASALAGKAASTHSHVIGDTTGLEAALDAKAPTASPTFTGLVTAAGARVTPASAMGGTVIDVTKLDNTYSATGNATLTFSATPSAGTVFGLTITTDGTARTITVPSSKSANRGSTITSFVVPANATITVYWRYDGSTYHILGDPVTAAQAKAALSLTTADISGLATVATTGDADDLSGLAAVATSGAAADVTGLAAVATSGSASDLTTGVLPVARGGTGTATPGLVAGSNVTITGIWPNQTVNSTGGGGGGGTFSMDDGDAASTASASFDDGDAATA